MKKLALASLLFAMSCLPGCGGGDTAESISREMTSNMTELASILSGISDEASAKAAVPKIEAVRAKMRDAGKRAKNVPKIDAQTEQRIGQAMEKEMTAAMSSIASAQQKLTARPELMAIIEPALQNMEDDL